MAEANKQRIKVAIHDEAWQKLMSYCRYASPDEVGGLAHAEIENGVISISNPFILPQEVSGSNFEMDRKELVGFIGSYEQIPKVKCVWHSHVNMSAFFSTCDRETSTTLSMLGRMMRGESSWFVSLVVNCRGEYECKVDMFHPFQCTLEAEVVRTSASDADVEKEVKALCKKRVYHYEQGEKGTNRYFPGFGGYDSTKDESGIIIVGGKGGKGEKGKKGPHGPYSEDDVFRHLYPGVEGD